jgi:hypothetical protein
MEAWVGPAIVAAVISGLVSLIVVQLNFRQERKIERLRRDEKIRDFQIALRAEIRSELTNLKRFDLDGVLLEMERRYADEPGFSVSVPRVAKHIVFEAIVSELHVLPEAVIAPVVLYARQRQVVESLTEDMRDQTFKSLSKERQLSMYRDYLEMWKQWRELAEQAENALSAGAFQ